MTTYDQEHHAAAMRELRSDAEWITRLRREHAAEGHRHPGDPVTATDAGDPDEDRPVADIVADLNAASDAAVAARRAAHVHTDSGRCLYCERQNVRGM